MRLDRLMSQRSLHIVSLLIPKVLSSPLSLHSTGLDKPTPIAITPSYVANVAENTHTVLTGPSGQEALVPIVGGEACWFCPQERENDEISGGWALLGIDKPGTYQPLALSTFTEPIPIITVSLSGNPTYTSTTTATTKDIATKVKRDSDPTTTTYSEQFEIVRPYLPKDVRDGKVGSDDGWAIKGKHMGTKLGIIPWPEHYRLIAGYITITETEYCDERDDGVKKNVHVDFEAHDYHLHLDMQVIDGKTRKMVKPSPQPPRRPWWKAEYQGFELLGRIKQSLTVDDIQNKALGLAKEMNDRGGYDGCLRNCRDFVVDLYKKIKLQ